MILDRTACCPLRRRRGWKVVTGRAAFVSRTVSLHSCFERERKGVNLFGNGR